MIPKDISAPSTGRYGRIAMALHWLLALLLPIQVALGWYMLSIEDQPGSEWYFALHVSLGLTIAALVALRVVRRVGHAPHPLPASVARWEVKSSRASHLLLYLAMVLLPVTGYLGASFSGDPVSYFGLPLPGWSAKDDALKELFFSAHSVIAWMLVGLVVVHVLAAVKHLVKDKDGVFGRMWPR